MSGIVDLKLSVPFIPVMEQWTCFSPSGSNESAENNTDLYVVFTAFTKTSYKCVGMWESYKTMAIHTI
jgi:hypothetical protein